MDNLDFKDCITFANKNPIAWLATIDKDKPRVRGLGLWFADDSGFYFQIGGMKDLYRQLKENPQVEFAFFQPEEMVGTMLRVSGKVEFLDDPELKERVLEDRPFLKEFELTPDNPLLVIFRISKGEAHFWTWDTNLKPKEIIFFGD